MYPASWATVASFVTLGLTWWESCLAVFLGSVFVAVVITGTSVPNFSPEGRGRTPPHSG
jgi:NCS1 family nucleobase:cation symporter-1